VSVLPLPMPLKIQHMLQDFCCVYIPCPLILETACNVENADIYLNSINMPSLSGANMTNKPINASQSLSCSQVRPQSLSSRDTDQSYECTIEDASAVAASSMPTSSTPAPQAPVDSSSTHHGLSKSAKIGLGVGLGLGIPLLLAGAFFLWTRSKKRTPRGRESSRGEYAKADVERRSSGAAVSPVREHEEEEAKAPNVRDDELEESGQRPVSALLGEHHGRESPEMEHQEPVELEEQQGVRYEMEEQQGVRHEMDARSLHDIELGDDTEAESRSLSDIERGHGKTLS
jgi:hypothetical protein